MPDDFEVRLTLTCAREVSSLHRPAIEADFFKFLRELRHRDLPENRNPHPITRSGGERVMRAWIDAGSKAGWRALYVEARGMRIVFSFADHERTDLRQVRLDGSGDSVRIVLQREDASGAATAADFRWLADTGLPDEFAPSIVESSDPQRLLSALREDIARKVRRKLGAEEAVETAAVGGNTELDYLEALYRGWETRAAAPTSELAPRDPLVEQLSDLLLREARVALIGPSGTGKSSVLRLLYARIHASGLPVRLVRARDLEGDRLKTLEEGAGFLLVDGLDELEAATRRSEWEPILDAWRGGCVIASRTRPASNDVQTLAMPWLADDEAELMWEVTLRAPGGIPWRNLPKVLDEQDDTPLLRDPFFLQALAAAPWREGQPGDPYRALLVGRCAGDLALFHTFLSVARTIDREGSAELDEGELEAARQLCERGLLTEGPARTFEATHSRLVQAALALMLPRPLRGIDILALAGGGRDSRQVADQTIQRRPQMLVEIAALGESGENLVLSILRESTWLYHATGEYRIPPAGFTESAWQRLVVRSGRVERIGVRERPGWLAVEARQASLTWDDRLRVARAVEGAATALQLGEVELARLAIVELAVRGLIRGVVVELDASREARGIVERTKEVCAQFGLRHQVGFVPDAVRLDCLVVKTRKERSFGRSPAALLEFGGPPDTGDGTQMDERLPSVEFAAFTEAEAKEWGDHGERPARLLDVRFIGLGDGSEPEWLRLARGAPIQVLASEQHHPAVRQILASRIEALAVASPNPPLRVTVGGLPTPGWVPDANCVVLLACDEPDAVLARKWLASLLEPGRPRTHVVVAVVVDCDGRGGQNLDGWLLGDSPLAVSLRHELEQDLTLERASADEQRRMVGEWSKEMAEEEHEFEEAAAEARRAAEEAAAEGAPEDAPYNDESQAPRSPATFVVAGEWPYSASGPAPTAPRATFTPRVIRVPRGTDRSTRDPLPTPSVDDES